MPPLLGDLMRIWIVVALCAALGGCAASRQEVVSRLGQEYLGKNVDVLVAQWGPPNSTFKMNSGATSYQWQLSAVTDIDADRGVGTASSRYCKVTVIALPTGIISQLNTDDANAGGGLIGMVGGYGSMCGQRLGIQRQS
jgi:hypothetical protein